MTPEPEPSRTVDADGVRRTLKPRAPVGRSIFAAGIALAVLFVGLTFLDGEESAEGDAAQQADEGDPSTSPDDGRPEGPTPRAPRAPVRVAASGPDEEFPIQMTTPADLPPGTKSGIQLFPAPGTKPIKRGLVVPEGFELPPGYVRHYQTLDDGTQLPAVLTFHPDFQPKDAQGHPIDVGEDRLVPEALAPPGLPLRRLVLPGEEPKDVHE